MQRELDGGDERRLRLITPHGHIDGTLRTNRGVSTLHYLNVLSSSNDFVVVHEPVEADSRLMLDRSDVAVAVDSVLLVQELTERKPTPGDPAAAARYQRSPVRLRVGDYSLEGFIHHPPGVDPISRVNTDRQPFFAMSSVSVMGPHLQTSAAFLAVRRSEVLLVQQSRDDVNLDGVGEAEAETVGP